MSYDVLFIAADALSTNTFSHLDFAQLDGKYGLARDEWRDLLNTRQPKWVVDGTEMIFPAIELFFRGGRRLQLPKSAREDYYAERRRLELRYLNGIFMADYLTRRGFTVEVINSLSPDYRELAAALAGEPRVLAISTTFIANRRRVEEIARWAKQHAPGITVVAGGPLVHYSWLIRTSRPELSAVESIRGLYFFLDDGPVPDPVIDAFVVDARGESTLTDLLARVQAGRGITDLPNLAYYDDANELVITSRAPERTSLQEEMIDWENLDEKYLGPVVAVRGSRGCPLRCKFCSFAVLEPDWELKSVERVERELRKISSRSSVKSICFADDNLFLRRTQVDQYTRMMADARLPFRWSSFIRADSITSENVQWITDSGCEGATFGIESGDPEVLRNMRKAQRPENVLRSVELLNQRGITTHSTLIVGFPGETAESVDNTIRMLQRYADGGPGTNWFMAWINFVLPLTPVDDERERWGLEGYLCDWKHETMNVGDAYRQTHRLFCAVNQGAYVGYEYDDLSRFAGRPSHRNQALQMRHVMAMTDAHGTEFHHGVSRAEALSRLERLTLAPTR